MTVKNLRDLCAQEIVRLTLRYSKEVSYTEEVWLVIYEIWSYIALLPYYSTSLYYKILNKYSHWLSHDIKRNYSEYCDFPNQTADEVFNLLVTCQSPKLIFDYRRERKRIIPENTISIVENPKLAKYFELTLLELDLSGGDFCRDDALLIILLPKCRSLQILCLGNAGSEEVLNAATSCPLTKLQLEERSPLNPRLPQKLILKYLLGRNIGETDHVLEFWLLKNKPLGVDGMVEERSEVKENRIRALEEFMSECKPTWPNMRILIFGNCRICSEALFLCLLVLKSLEEISVHRIQSDEILNTCNLVFNSLGFHQEISLRRLALWAGWSGLHTNVLHITPHIEELCVVAHGYANLNLRETINKNENLSRINTLILVGLRHAGPTVFQSTNPFLTNVENLQISGVILTTEELVNIFTCFPNLLELKLDYSELRNYRYVLQNRRYPHRIKLERFSVETSYMDKEFMDALCAMSSNLKALSIRGKTKNFALSFAVQEIYLHQIDSKLENLELHPEYPLHVRGLLKLSRNRNIMNGRRFLLHVPLPSLTKNEIRRLTNNGWHIIPTCSRC